MKTTTDRGGFPGVSEEDFLTQDELDKAKEEAAWEEYCEWVKTLDE